VPLVPGQIYALGSWPPRSDSQALGTALVLLPALMWLASLIVAWLAVERLVIRHIGRLSGSMTSFAGGNRLVGDIAMPGAAAELREMASAYEAMTEAILHDEAELEDMVHQREVLLREVHHRVKNNLQLIASIINMQLRRTRSEEARTVMRGLQDRVMSLATIHRELYQTSGQSDIQVAELLGNIVRQIGNLAGTAKRRIEIATRIDAVEMTPDQAVPLALLVAEALTNALKHAAAPRGSVPDFALSFLRDGPEAVELCVRNSAAGPRPALGDSAQEGDEDGGLGSQLIDAFAMQLGGRVERRHDDGTYELRLRFALRPLLHGEARNAPSQA
jgi:two-component sensor histidine kinase